MYHYYVVRHSARKIENITITGTPAFKQYYIYYGVNDADTQYKTKSGPFTSFRDAENELFKTRPTAQRKTRGTEGGKRK